MNMAGDDQAIHDELFKALKAKVNSDFRIREASNTVNGSISPMDRADGIAVKTMMSGYNREQYKSAIQEAFNRYKENDCRIDFLEKDERSDLENLLTEAARLAKKDYFLQTVLNDATLLEGIEPIIEALRRYSFEFVGINRDIDNYCANEANGITRDELNAFLDQALEEEIQFSNSHNIDYREYALRKGNTEMAQHLDDTGFSARVDDLYSALKRGEIEIAQNLVNNKFNVTDCLSQVIYYNEHDLLDTLISLEGFDINSHGDSFNLALKKESTEMAQHFINAGFDATKCLSDLIYYNEHDLLKTLASLEGFDVNVYLDRDTAFHRSIICDKDERVVKALVEEGAFMNLGSMVGSPLEELVDSNNTDMIKYLIESGANVSKSDCLLMAVRNDSGEMCKILVESGQYSDVQGKKKVYNAIQESVTENNEEAFNSIMTYYYLNEDLCSRVDCAKDVRKIFEYEIDNPEYFRQDGVRRQRQTLLGQFSYISDGASEETLQKLQSQDEYLYNSFTSLSTKLLFETGKVGPEEIRGFLEFMRQKIDSPELISQKLDCIGYCAYQAIERGLLTLKTCSALYDRTPNHKHFRLLTSDAALDLVESGNATFKDLSYLYYNSLSPHDLEAVIQDSTDDVTKLETILDYSRQFREEFDAKLDQKLAEFDPSYRNNQRGILNDPPLSFKGVDEGFDGASYEKLVSNPALIELSKLPNVSIEELLEQCKSGTSEEEEKLEILSSTDTKVFLERFPNISLTEFASLDSEGITETLKEYFFTQSHRILESIKSLARNMGIEIECCIPKGGDTIDYDSSDSDSSDYDSDEEFIETILNLAPPKGWKGVNDETIDPDESDHKAIELVSGIMRTKEDLQGVSEVCEILSDNASYVNTSCGLHIHVGILEKGLDKSQTMDNKDLNAIKQILINYIVLEEYGLEFTNRIYQLNSLTSSNQDVLDQRVADIISANNLMELMDKISPGRSNEGVNLESIYQHGTIEFRSHPGTVNPQDMMSWIKAINDLVGLSDGMLENGEPYFPNAEQQKQIKQILEELQQNNACVIKPKTRGKENPMAEIDGAQASIESVIGKKRGR